MEAINGPSLFQRYRRQLEEVALLVQMNDEEIRAILTCGEVVESKKGETVFEEGDCGDALFIILKGCYRIEKRVEGRQERVLARMKEGDFFGEMSLIDIEPRSATVRAESEGVLLRIDSERLREMLCEKGRGELLALLMTNLARTLSRRLRDMNER